MKIARMSLLAILVVSFFLTAAKCVSAEAYLEIVPPATFKPLTDNVRVSVDADTSIDSVEFYLDEKRLSKDPDRPFSFSVPFGEFPKLHTIAVVGYSRGVPVAEVSREVNNPFAEPFGVRIVSPARDTAVVGLAVIRANLELGPKDILRNVECLIGGELQDGAFVGAISVGVLSDAPFVWEYEFPSADESTQVRVVATLESGKTAEDFRLVNLAKNRDEIFVEEVQVYVGVFDKDGSPVPGLKRDDFHVAEDGEEMDILKFGSGDYPIITAIALDSSASTRGILYPVSQSTVAFLPSLLSGEEDRVLAIGFSGEPYLVCAPTAELAVLHRSITGMSAWGLTDVFEAVNSGLYHLSGLGGRRVLILVTNGEGSDELRKESLPEFEYLLKHARESDVMIYAIGIGFSKTDKVLKNRLEKISEATGGRMISISSPDELPGEYERIGGELRSQYRIVYTPPTSSVVRKWRDIKVRVPGYSVRTRAGYHP